MHLQPKVFFTCSVALLIASCGVGRVASDDKGTLVHAITAGPDTRAALGITVWQIYENQATDRRVADGVTAGGAVSIELDSSPAGFTYTGSGGRVAVDSGGNLIVGSISLLSEAQRAGAFLDADVRTTAAAEPHDGEVYVCDTEAAALGAAIQNAVMTCQAMPHTQACRDAIHGIRDAIHVLIDCVLGQIRDGGIAGAGDGGGAQGDGGSGNGNGADGGMAAICQPGSGDSVFALPSCNQSFQGAPAGSPCRGALQCQTTCCNCGNGRSFEVAACINGQCANMANACTCLHDLAGPTCP